MKKYKVMYLIGTLYIGITVMNYIKPFKEFSELENRYLAKKPKFSINSIKNGSYTSNYEKYINDQFVFRDLWITLKSLSEESLGKLENNNIIFGADNYLFDKFNNINQIQLESNVKFLKEFPKELEIKPSLMIIPSSYTLLKDKLPKGNIGLVKEEDEISSIYKILNSDYNTINLESLWKERYNDIYYKTDHHWTTLGAYYGYNDYIKSIQGTPVELDDLNYKTIDGFYGTYYSKAKRYNSQEDSITLYETPEVKMTVGDRVYNTIYNEEAFKGRDKYSGFIYGNNPITVIERVESLNNSKNILVIKDSYGNSLVPFLTHNYNKIVVLDLRGYKESIKKLIEEEDIDEVLILYSLTNLSTDSNLFRLLY